MQHLALFVLCEVFLLDTSGDIYDIWKMRKQAFSRRMLKLFGLHSPSPPICGGREARG